MLKLSPICDKGAHECYLNIHGCALLCPLSVLKVLLHLLCMSAAEYVHLRLHGQHLALTSPGLVRDADVISLWWLHL